MEKKLNILILEDNPTDAELITYALRKEGMQFESMWVDNRADFVAALTKNTFDIILSDNSLPQFEAREAVQIVRSMLPDMPFILVTGTVHEDFIISIMKLGIDDYILKDRLKRLPSAIENALQNRQAAREKQKAELELKESEQKYRSMIERISDGFFVLDYDWNFQYVNKVASDLFQRPQTELLGKNIWAEFPETVNGAVYHFLQKALYTQKEQFWEGFSNAFQKWAQISAYPSNEGLVVYYRDITETKEAEQAFQKSQQQYKEMVERITDGFYALDNDFRYLFLNEKAGEIILHKPEEVLGKTVWEIFPDLVGTELYKNFLRARDEQVYVHFTEHYEATGIWKDIQLYPSPDGLSVFVKDISEQKKSELAVKESEEVRNLIMSSALDAIICVNNENRFIFWNKRAEELFGWTFGEIKNETLTTTIIPQQHRSAHAHAMEHYLVTGKKKVSGRMMELTALKKSGKEFPIELFMIPVKAGSSEFFCAFIRDISERKELQQKLIDQQQKAAREIIATALDAQEKERNFIGQELHDNINQILIGTKMMLQLTMSNVEKNKHLLEKCVESLSDVIKENRKLAHEMVTPNIEHESIHNLLQGLTEDMFVSDLPKVTVRVNPGADRQLHSKQKLTLYRIAQEQCSNILKYANASEMEIVVEEKNGAVEMTIHDNGQGMDAEKKPNGIGLRNINSRLSIYNGTSKIITGPGKGFTLTVQIPFSAG